MGNHFHLLLETPEPILVMGMKWLLGTFSQGWNARRSRRGHVFQRRYKAVPVSAAAESPHYFRIVADYIHLCDLAVRALAATGLPPDTGSLSELRKGDVGKILVANLLRKHTSAGNRWLAQRLAMGHTGSVSRLMGAFGKNKANRKKLSELEKMLKCET
jgi:hypothetical protein